MAARRFVEAIEWTLANEILNMVRNRPVRLVFYTYIFGTDYAIPLAMIAKYEDGMSDDHFLVRTYGHEEFDRWDTLEPIFTSIDQCSRYIATHYCPEPDMFCIGTRVLRDENYPMGARHVDDLSNRSTARQWLLECSTMYADYLMESGILLEDDDEDGQWDWVVSDEDHFRELLENQIDFLAVVFFAGMDF